MYRIVAVLTVVYVTLAMGACSFFSAGDDGDSGDNAIVGTVEYPDEPVPVYAETETDTADVVAASLTASARRGTRTEVESFEYEIVRVARILPLTVDGQEVQAADIKVSGTTAVVAYNAAGDPFLGGIHVLDISDAEHPVIEAELLFTDRDVNAVTIDGSRLYFGGAKVPTENADPSVERRSFVSWVQLGSIDRETALGNTTFLPSYSVTGIARRGNSIYASAGAEGGVLAQLSLDLAEENLVERSDLRDVEEYQNGVIALAGTADADDGATPGIVIYRQNDLANPLVLPIDEFGSEYGKATIEVFRGTVALLGLSEAGLKIVDLTDDDSASTVSYLYEEENPVAAWSEFTSTNSVSTNGALIFSANGEYGFRVLRINGNLAVNGTVEPVGFVSFEDHPTDDGFWSANHVAFSNNTLFVASGAGGVNIYTVDNAAGR